MKTASTAYKRAMKKLLRNPSHAIIKFQNSDTSAAGDGAWTDNGELPYSETETLDYDRIYGRTLATLELNRWALDGTQNIYSGNPAGVVDGFISSIMSDAEGGFNTPPLLTREFSAIHRISGLTILFDSRTKEWPVNLTVEYYLGGVIIDTLTIEGLTESSTIVEHPVNAYDGLVLRVNTLLPYRRFRTEGIVFGVVREYTDDEILAIHQAHDVDPLTRRLPDEQFSFTIIDYEHKYDPDNPQGFYTYVEEKSPVSVTYGYELDDGSIEWLDPDGYLLNSKPSVRNEQVTFGATGLIGSLSDNYYKSKVGEKSLYDMAEDVLQDANLKPTQTGTIPWEIDPSLKQMYSTAVLPIDTHMNCLQLIAHAACSRLYTDDSNIIHIKPFDAFVMDTYTGVTTDNGHLSWSNWDAVNTGSVSNERYVTLELNRWVLSEENEQSIVPDEDIQNCGYVSSYISGMNGSFDTRPVVTRVFDNYCDLNALRIRFDEVLDEWPRAVQVDYYRDNTRVDRQTVSDISESEVAITSVAATKINRLVITFTKAVPYSRVRISRMYYRTSDFYLDFNSITDKSQIATKTDQLKSVAVTQYSYLPPTGEPLILYNETVTDTTLHVEFDQPISDMTIEVDGGEVLSSNIYGRAVDMELTDGEKQVVVTGRLLTESTVVITKTINSTGEVDTEQNPLITNEALRVALTEHVANYLSMRSTYDVSYRGNPELEVGDIIGMQTRYTDDLPSLVLTDSIDYNGTLSGTVKVKGLK